MGCCKLRWVAIGGAERSTVVGDGGAEHLLEAHRLGTQLDFIPRLFLRRPTFVLDWKRKPPAFSPRQDNRSGVVVPGAAKFANVHLAGDSETERPHAQSARGHQVCSRLCSALMSAVVEYASFFGEPVLVPLMFEMNERPLPLAEKEMLEPG